MSTHLDRPPRLVLPGRSSIRFDPEPMPAARLGSVLSALPSAASAPLRCYPMLLNVRHGLDGRACRYEGMLRDVAPCPRWPELGPLLGAPDTGTGPHFALVFVLDDGEMMAKYGLRGGRFGLVESGAAMRAVTLRLADERLCGYQPGGVAERPLLRLLGLSDRDARVAGVFVGGVPKL